jgi:peptidylprolyl isomerase
METAKNGDRVKVHYTGTLRDGQVFDSSRDKDPLEFTIGEGKLLPAFEKEVQGLKIGETKTLNLAPGDAYGEYHDELVAKIPREELPDDLDPRVGMRLRIQVPQGQVVPVRVIELDDERMTVDANHELAGKDLDFEITLVEILSQ